MASSRPAPKIIKHHFLIAFSLLIFIALGCDVRDNKLHVKNESSYAIYFTYSCDSILNNTMRISTRKDLNPSGTPLKKQIIPDEYLKPGQTVSVMMSVGFGNSVETYINNCQTKKLFVYFFYADTIENYEWWEITKNKKFIKRIDLNVDSLKKLNWLIVYK